MFHNIIVQWKPSVLAITFSVPACLFGVICSPQRRRKKKKASARDRDCLQEEIGLMVTLWEKADLWAPSALTQNGLLAFLRDRGQPPREGAEARERIAKH